MRIKPLSFLCSFTVLIIASSTILAASGKDSVAQLVPPEALRDAAEPLPNEVLDNLTVINESNPNIKWDGQRGKSRVLVATFTRANGHASGKTASVIWVTVAPELKDFCKKYKDTEATTEELNRRLNQLLGLRPNEGFTHIAEIWVDPQYLRRPTLNPDIRRYPTKSEPLPIQLPLQFPQGVDIAYQKWFTKQVEDRAKSSYPWTGLGYTYDWSPKTNLQNHAGLSEFIIFPTPETPIPIEVKQILPTEKYCGME
ncbi:hypothetical protein TUMEXPCC7403_00490 [Tumidithrix helvetica PCC 7403]|uniref:hypothetical protein n=1 Tax=Tumidithrix helvetica TaxID=3457545 RepID=UPI003CB86DE8